MTKESAKHDWKDVGDREYVCTKCGGWKGRHTTNVAWACEGKKAEKTICAVVLNDEGQILSYTCKSTIQACEEWCEAHFPGWGKMKERGCKVVQAELRVLDAKESS
jgi:hypothetical protein